MAASESKTNNWLYRASDEEHDIILEAVRRGRYPSIAAFVREACLRMAHDDDVRPVMSRLYDMTETLTDELKKLNRMQQEERDE